MIFKRSRNKSKSRWAFGSVMVCCFAMVSLSIYSGGSHYSPILVSGIDDEHSSLGFLKSNSLLKQNDPQFELVRGREIIENPEQLFDISACASTRHRCLFVREQLGLKPLQAEDWFDNHMLPLIKKKHLLIDVGANLGQFAIPMAKQGHNVISFEPVHRTCMSLKEKVTISNLSSSVQVHCAAASDRAKTVLFYKAPGLSSGYREVSAVEAQSLDTEAIEKLDSVTVDSVVEGRVVFLLKTDTQGYEMNVLHGSQELLKNGRAKFLLIEFSYGLLSAAGTDPREVLEFVYDFGYRCSYLGFHGVKSLSPLSYGLVERLGLFNGSFVEFDHFIASLEKVSNGRSGWTDLFCWRECTPIK